MGRVAARTRNPAACGSSLQLHRRSEVGSPRRPGPTLADPPSLFSPVATATRCLNVVEVGSPCQPGPPLADPPSPLAPVATATRCLNCKRCVIEVAALPPGPPLAVLSPRQPGLSLADPPFAAVGESPTPMKPLVDVGRCGCSWDVGGDIAVAVGRAGWAGLWASCCPSACW